MQRKLTFLIVALLVSSISLLQAQTTITLNPSEDNTLYQRADGSRSNGAGERLFVGRTNQSSNNLRRALVRFGDIADSIPEGATVTEVSLIFRVSRATATNTSDVSLHRVNRSWGEGSSDAANNEGAGIAAAGGDATWIHAFSDTINWTTAGGDFVQTPSASTSVNNVGNYTWTSSEMVDDVNAWLEQPDENHGWILVGDETTAKSAKRLDSRESSNPASLSITYTLASSSIDGLQTSPLQLYPNPTQDKLNIVFPSPGSAEISILDISGRTLGQSQINGSKANLSLADYPAGIYMIILRQDDRSYRGRVIKE
ncbi:MAG: DNRLRE domain-containing protein [Bacteroidota bacterium]